MAEQIAGAGLPANVAEILAAEATVGVETPIENGHLVKAPTLECLVERHRARLSIHEGGTCGRESSANDNGHARIIGSIEDWLYDRIDVDGEGVVLRSADDLRAFLSLTR